MILVCIPPETQVLAVFIPSSETRYTAAGPLA